MLQVKAVDHGLLQSRYRLTKQRAAVLRALSDGTHLSAETILERVRRDMPGVSLGTIYRTLDILREIGLVQIFSYGGIAARYEATLEKHHHMLCSVCRSLVNVRAESLADIAHAIAADEGYTEIDFALTIVGPCADCAQQSQASATTFAPSS
ncbi:MAG: transcriptional repressor [Candidatus Eremiobacteraeota bacterium]|nr:transcriptional repressor [Candidatus Eremiobacteraeota bacterium]